MTGFEPALHGFAIRYLTIRYTPTNKYCMEINVNNFLLLYGNNKHPYQLTGSWGVHDGFKLNEFLHPPKKEFVPDKLLTINCSASPGGNYRVSRYDAIIPITHSFHPLPDRDRSRTASGLSV